MTRNAKLTVSVIAVLCISMLLAFGVSAAKFADIENHWGKEYIEYGVERGYINGFEDGTFKPDEKVTRAQFAKMINGAVKISGTSKIGFTDVKSKDWFYADIEKAQYAAYVAGYEDGSFKPNNPITRQEAAVVLSRIVLPVSDRAELSSFADGKTIDTWAQDAVLMIARKGYIKGDEKQNFAPKGILTRAAAAKLICEFVKNENIVNGAYKIEKGETISELLFTDDVIIKTDGVADIVFESCRVLGNVDVRSSGILVDFSSSAIATVVNNGEEGVYIEADAKSTVRNTKVNYPATVKGDAFGTVYLDNKNLDSGTVVINGSIKTVEVDSDAVIKVAGTVDAVNVNSKCNLVIQSGTVKTLTVAKSAAGSTINLSSKTTVEKAVNNGAVSYKGDGRIKLSDEAVTGTTYENEPDEATGKGAASGTTTNENVDSKFFNGVEVSPTKGKTGVSENVKIYFYFDEAVTNDKGKAVTADYLEDNIELRKTNATTGTKIPFEATINSTKKTISILPDKALTQGSKYYVVIPEGKLTYNDGSANPKYSTYFTVGEDDEETSTTADVDVEIEPGSGDTAPVDTKITINFSKAVYKSKSKGALTESYCEDSAFEIRKKSSSGDEVGFTADVVSTKKVVLTPNEMLEPGVKYYVIMNNTLYNADGDLIGKKSTSFTADDGLAISVTPSNNSTGVPVVPEIVLEFSETVLKYNGDDLDDAYIEDEVVELRLGTKSGTTVAFEAEVAKGSKKVTIVPDALTPGKKYCLVILKETLLGEKSDEENEEILSYFTVAAKTAPQISPADNKRNVGVDTDIRVTFSGDLYAYAKTDSVAAKEKLTNANISDYVKTKEAIVLKKKSSSGTPVKCDVELVDDRTIVLTPNSELSLNLDYYVVVKANMFYIGGTTDKNAALTTMFDTNEALKPTFSHDGEEDVAITTSSFKISFSEAITQPNGDDLSAKYVKNNVVEFCEKATGTPVDYKLTLSTDFKTMTLAPTGDLKGGTWYEFKVNAGTIMNNSGMTNQTYTSEFRTVVKINNKVTFSPTNGTKNVSVYVNPTITYATPIYKSNLDDITEDYLNENGYIALYKESVSDANLVDAYYEINDDFTVITIIPDEPLEKNKKYVVQIDYKQFAYENDATMSSSYKTFNFTTKNEDEEPPLECPICGENHEEKDCPENIECPLCHGRHAEANHVCSKCGEKGHETEQWCTTCKTHEHKTEDKHCGFCGKFDHVDDDCPSKPECPICFEEHKQEDHVCSKCGEKGHERKMWCENCRSHSHNAEAAHCTICGKYGHEEAKCPERIICPFCGAEHTEEEHLCTKCGELGHQDETWCETCGAHSHNTTDTHCTICGLNGHADADCPENDSGEGSGEGA